MTTTQKIYKVWGELTAITDAYILQLCTYKEK